MGRNKIYPHRITLPLSDELMSGIEKARLDGEDRLTLIRAAIRREVELRLGPLDQSDDKS